MNKSKYPLTFPQKRIIIIEKLNPETPIHNIGGVTYFYWDLDVLLMKKALINFIQTNDALWTILVEENGIFSQILEKPDEMDIDYFDFSKDEDPELSQREWSEMEFKKPFQLYTGNKLFYFGLFKISQNKYGCLAKFHHLISDGWSIKIVNEAAIRLYGLLLKDAPMTNEEKYSYVEFIEKEASYLKSDFYNQDKKYWKSMFQDLPEFGVSKTSPETKSKRKIFFFDKNISDWMRNYLKDKRISFNTFFITLYLIYLYKTTRMKDICIGTPVLNRLGARQKKIFGIFSALCRCGIK